MPDKLNLAQLPTPIQRLPRLSLFFSKHADVNLYVKRDDLTHGPATGNKIRKLEYLLAEALRKKAQTVITCGGLQSNHARATAILARQQGLGCILFLRGEPPKSQYALQGNLLLDALVGAQIQYVSSEQYENIHETVLEMSEELRRQNPNANQPYFIPEGGSNEIGAMGYVDGFREILSQAGHNELPEVFSSIVLANGSGGTHAGLLLGRNLSAWEDLCRIVSFNVCRTSREMSERVKLIVIAAIQRNQIPISFMPSDIDVIDGYVGPGYAQATPELYDFLVDIARQDGLILDPVYTGKAFWGLYQELTASKARASVFGKNILFLHTGGLPSLFTDHAQELTRAIERKDLANVG